MMNSTMDFTATAAGSASDMASDADLPLRVFDAWAVVAGGLAHTSTVLSRWRVAMVEEIARRFGLRLRLSGSDFAASERWQRRRPDQAWRVEPSGWLTLLFVRPFGSGSDRLD